MPKQLPGNKHFTGTGPDGREWVHGIPLATDAEVIQARMFKASIEAQVATKMGNHLKWRKEHNIVLDHPDDGWVYRPWSAQPLLRYDGTKFGMSSGSSSCYHSEYEQYGMIEPCYPSFVAGTIGYGDRICLGHWGTERFMKVIAVLDCNNDLHGVVVSCKENPVKWRIPPPRGPHGLCRYQVVFDRDPDYPNYFAEKRDKDHLNSVEADFEETCYPTDRPFPSDKYWKRKNRSEGPGCLGMIMMVFTLIVLLDKLLF